VPLETTGVRSANGFTKRGMMMDANTITTDQATMETNGEATVPCKIYATRSEAEANKPADAPKSLKVFEVSKDGASLGFMLGRGYDPCLAALARRDGFAVSLGSSAPVTKEAVAAKLSEFTDDELAAMGLSRKKGKK
jgi:hypothetical protein